MYAYIALANYKMPEIKFVCTVHVPQFHPQLKLSELAEAADRWQVYFLNHIRDHVEHRLQTDQLEKVNQHL